MSAAPSVRLAGRLLRARTRILSLRAGEHARTGLVPSVAAATAALELTRSHPELIAHCGIFPTENAGLQFEGRAWQVLFEVEIDREGKLAGSAYGVDCECVDELPLPEMEARLDWSFSVPRSEWKVLVDYDGPQAVEIAHPEGPAIALACAPGAEEGSEADFLAVLPQRDPRQAYEADLICTRALMMDPTSRLFLGRADLGGLHFRPYHGDPEERMLPAEGLMNSDLQAAVAEPSTAHPEAHAEPSEDTAVL